MDDSWSKVLQSYWCRIARDTEDTLELVLRDFKRRHLSFNDNFKDSFLQRTSTRITFTYEEFVKNALFEEKLFRSHSINNDAGYQGQNDRSNNGDKRVASLHQPDQHSAAIQTSILDRVPSNASQATEAMLNGAVETANQNTVDEQLLEAYATPADRESYTAVKTNDSFSFCQCSTRNCLESTSLSFIANQNTEQFGERCQEPRENVNILTTVDQSNQPPVDTNDDVSFCQCSVVHGVDQTNISTSNVEALTPQERSIDEDINGQPSQCDENVVNASEFEQPMTSNSGNEDDVITAAVADHELTFADLEASDAQRNDPGLLVNQINDERMTVSPIEISSDSIEDSSHVAASSNGQQSNNQEVATHDNENLSLRGCSPQKNCRQKKRKNFKKATKGNLNKKRRLVTDLNQKEKLKCELCDYATSHKGNFNTHMLIHSDEKMFKCEICAKGFSRKDHLKGHTRTHANQFPFQCSICRQGFSLEQTLKVHEKNCNRKCYECYLCKYMCFQKANLVKHMRIHSGETPFKCTVCAREFTRKDSLKRHMRTHANQFPFHCSICRQGFSRRREKNSHEKSCNQERFECYLCKYVSLRKDHVVRHMRKHTGTKPFRCSQCQKCFNQSSNLNVHMNRYHKKNVTNSKSK